MAGLLRRLLGEKDIERPRPFCSAIVVAAGRSERFGAENKMFAKLGGMPVLAHSLLTFEKSVCISEIIVVVRPENIVTVGDLCKDFGITKANKVILGGAERSASALLGLTEASREAEFAAIHDGARPNVTGKIIEDALEAAIKYNAAAPAVPVNDTVKSAKNNIVTKTLDRKNLFAVQTPQIFNIDLIKAALHKVVSENIPVTDDCMAVELMGASVYLTQGSFENIKITTSADLIIAEAVGGEI